MNYDETGITNDPGRKLMIVAKGIKHREHIMDHAKTNISVMFCIAASGIMLPPFVCYKAEHLFDTWKDNGPVGCEYFRSHSGWFDKFVFERWFLKIVLPYFQKLDPNNERDKFLIGDNLASHGSMSV